MILRGKMELRCVSAVCVYTCGDCAVTKDDTVSVAYVL